MSSWWIVLGLFVFSAVCATVAVAHEDETAMCTVDSTATQDTPGYGVTVFSTIAAAVDGCSASTVNVRFANRDDYFEQKGE
jgi:hypothetical protein